MSDSSASPYSGTTTSGTENNNNSAASFSNNNNNIGTNGNINNTDNYDNDSSDDKRIKRRDRKTISCTTCRKRKIRCDRGKPICGACKKNNVPTHLCVYDDTPWVSAVVKEETLKNEITEMREANEKLNLLIRKRKAENEALKARHEEKFRTRDASALPQAHSSMTTSQHEKQHEQQQQQKNGPKIRDDVYERLKDAQVNIRRLALTKFNAKNTSTKTFGPFSWQAIGYREGTLLNEAIMLYEKYNDSFREQYHDLIKSRESFTAELLNFKQVYHTVNIEKRYTTIIVDSDKPDRNDVFGKKLQELAKAMPSFKIVERKFNYLFDMKYASSVDNFFSKDEIKQDFRRIIKKTKKGGIEIDVYSANRDYYIEIVKLAGILLFIKFGIVFSEEDDEQIMDSDNLLARYMITCLYFGRAFIRPSIATLTVIIFLEVLQSLNPDDSGDTLYITSGRIDAQLFVSLAYNIATSLGLANSYDKIPETARNPTDPNDSPVTKEVLQGIWANLLNLDWKQSILTGSPLTIPTFMGYDKTSSVKKLNHIGMMRKIIEKYSVFSDKTDQALNRFLTFEANPYFTRRNLEDDLIELTAYFNDNVKSEPKFWDRFKLRTMDTSPEKDNRLLQTLEVLDLTTSLNFFLFESYENLANPINVDQDVKLSAEERIAMKNLANIHMNNTLLHACYMLKIVDWCLAQVLTNEAVSKNRLLQITSYPILKRTADKAIMVCCTMILRHSTLDEFGVVYKYDLTDIETTRPEKLNIFNHSLQEFDDLCFQTNVNNHRRQHYFTENFLNDFMHYWSNIYRYIKQNELMKKDIKWFLVFRELFFGLYYLLQNKRKHCANGKKGDPTKNCSLTEVFVLAEHLKFKNMYENNIDPDRDYNRYTLNYILN